MLENNWLMLLAVHYRVMEHAGSLESTQEARVGKMSYLYMGCRVQYGISVLLSPKMNP